MEIQIGTPDSINFNLGNIGSGAVNSVNGKTGDVVLDYEDVGALSEDTELFSGDYNDLTNKPTIPVVPTNVSAFTNDAGYLTQHQDISGKQDKLTAGVNITITDNVISASGGLSEVAWGGITGTLTNQNDLVNALNNKITVGSLAEVAESGDYNDLSNKPTIPSISGLATETYVDTGLATKQNTLTAGIGIDINNNVIRTTNDLVFFHAEHEVVSPQEVWNHYCKGELLYVIRSTLLGFYITCFMTYSNYSRGNIGSTVPSDWMVSFDCLGTASFEPQALPVNITYNYTGYITSDNEWHVVNGGVKLLLTPPSPPETGTAVLKSINGVLTWVTE